MIEEASQSPVDCSQSPCGPDCQYAQTLTASYGEWHWCTHPQVGGRIMRDGRECRHFTSAVTSSGESAPLLWRR